MLQIAEIVRHALQEDLGDGDHTSLSTIPATAKGKARLMVKQPGVLAGVPVALEVFRQVDPSLQVNVFINDGAAIGPGDIVFEVSGASVSILSAERLALNFLQRLSGIATYTHHLASMISAWPARLLDTRKTTPLLRELEKYAVRMGGGENHRMGLYDMIMVKDNHVDFAGGIEAAIRRVTAYLQHIGKDLKIEIEVRNFHELDEVLVVGGVHRIMLDNFTPENLTKAVQLIAKRFETEASGGIHEGNIVDYAATGVDYISIGALTHQIRSLDLSLKAI